MAEVWQGPTTRRFHGGEVFLSEAKDLGNCKRGRATQRRREGGFSLVELLVSVIILVILAAIAVPTLLRAYRSYQLGDAASRVSGMMKSTRFTAIRKNAPYIGCQIRQNGSTWTVWTDLDDDGNPSTGEPQILISGTVQLLGGGSVPAPDAIVTSLGAASPTLNTLSPGNAKVYYDHRGARRFGPPPTFGGPPTVDVVYLGNPTIPDLEFRAVVIVPSGSVQVWAAAPGSVWRRIS